jgi:hypothetical protein
MSVGWWILSSRDLEDTVDRWHAGDHVLMQIVVVLDERSETAKNVSSIRTLAIVPTFGRVGLVCGAGWKQDRWRLDGPCLSTRQTIIPWTTKCSIPSIVDQTISGFVFV